MEKVPGRSDMMVFQLKATILRLKRGYSNFSSPVYKWPQSNARPSGIMLSESFSDLWDNSAPHPEQILQAGKVQNLRVALRKIDGCHIPANQTFSFWRQLGRPGREKGYVVGRELRQGCIIPTRAGGLCQLSNALYDAALKAKLEIVERHAHTQNIPGSLTEQGRDATVFWNYVDLRFKADTDLYIKAFLTSDKLMVQLWRWT
jgi:hypothetical protein